MRLDPSHGTPNSLEVIYALYEDRGVCVELYTKHSSIARPRRRFDVWLRRVTWQAMSHNPLEMFGIPRLLK
jgi:hypothetical protein